MTLATETPSTRPSFDVRDWLAEKSGCAADELRQTDRRIRSDLRGAFDPSYLRGDGYAGRVLIGPPNTNVESERPRRRVSAVWQAGSADTKIQAEAEIIW